MFFFSPMRRWKKQPELQRQITHRKSRCCADDSGGDGCWGGTPGGGNPGNIPGRGLGAQPELPGLRRRAAAVPEQDEERPDAPQWPQSTRGQGLHPRPLQGHSCLKGNPPHCCTFKAWGTVFWKGISQMMGCMYKAVNLHSKKKSNIMVVDIVYLLRFLASSCWFLVLVVIFFGQCFVFCYGIVY